MAESKAACMSRETRTTCLFLLLVLSARKVVLLAIAEIVDLSEQKPCCEWCMGKATRFFLRMPAV